MALIWNRFKKDKPEERDSLENPSVELMAALGHYDSLTLGGHLSGHGIRVSPETALTFAAVYSCVKVISESLGSLPFHLYEKSGHTRKQVEDDPRAYMLNEEPNSEMDSMILWETIIGHCLLWGNAYLFKEIDKGTGMTKALWPLQPNRTQIVRIPSGAIVYRTYLESGEERYLVQDEVLHVRGFGTGTYGISPIGAARRAIGIGISGDEYAGTFYTNQARPGGLIQVDKTMSEEQYNAFRARWNSGHQGMSNSNLIGILDNGMTWQDVGIPPGDHQFIENRKWQALDVCRVYRIQPHKAGFVEAGSVSYASVEQFNIDFVVDTIRPWATRVEKAVQRGVFGSEPDRMRGLYPKFQLNGLLRGDMVGRSTFYEKGIASGWLLKNEVRELEDLPYIDGLDDPPDEMDLLPDPAEVANPDLIPDPVVEELLV